MKKSSLVGLVVLCLTCFSSPAFSENLKIYDVIFESTALPVLTETIRIKLSKLDHPEILGIKGENPRIACDFYNAEPVKSLKRIIELNGKYIKRIRMGVHKKPKLKTRLVLDLIPLLDYTIQQIPSKAENMFSIMVQLAEKTHQKQNSKDINEPKVKDKKEQMDQQKQNGE